MMPLTLADKGKELTVQHIGGKEETVRFLENLGLVVGTPVSVVSEVDGSMIINVRDSRIALGKAMAAKIMV